MMNPQRLLQHFDTISEAPDAVAKLRKLILDLAVRGKLVGQDAGPPAAVSAKTRKDAAAPSPVDMPYVVPTGWSWVNIRDVVVEHRGGGTPSKNIASYWDGDVRWASVKDVGKSKYVDDTADRISEEGLAGSSSNLISPGHLIVVTRMGLGKVSINRVSIAINQDLRALKFSSSVSTDYAYIFFKTQAFQGSGLTVKGIKVEQLMATPFPLPPISEQHRIVAKVDELMALCDQLQAARDAREQQRDRLVAASLQRITITASEPDDTLDTTEAAPRCADQPRFHLRHLPQMTTRREHIQQLRQYLLALAVHGQLLTQDPNDEPAGVRVRTLRDAKRFALENGEGRERSPLEATLLDDCGGAIPAWWGLVTFDDVLLITGGVTKGRKLAGRETSAIPYLRVANVQRGRLDLRVMKTIEVPRSEIESYRLCCGDILLTEGGDWDKLGRAAVWNGEIDLCIHQNHVFRARAPRPDLLLPRWVELIANGPIGISYFQNAAKQT
ncbi:MAG: restriction endonuclease subunit S, partial [Lysobacter sp.]|nr:restriction endonuclease subunit S [Lysobacter sp.]